MEPDWRCDRLIVAFYGSVQVLEEREKLKEEREMRMTKKEYLIKELDRLRKQQGEFQDSDPAQQNISHSVITDQSELLFGL